MDGVLAIVRKDLKELFREGRMLFMFAMTGFIILSLPLEQVDSLTARQPVLIQVLLDLFVVYYSILVVLFISYAAVYRIFYREKNSASLASLLATPLSIRQIWAGKTLAVFLSGYGLAFVLIVVATGYLNYMHPGAMIWPSGYALIGFLVVDPILMFLLIGTLGLFYLLIKDEMKARVGFFILIFATFYLARMASLPTGWTALGYILLVAAAFAVLLLALMPLLNNERVIMSMDR